MRLRQAAWGLGLVLNGNKVISNSAAVGVSSGLRRWHPSSLPVDFVVVVLLEGTGSHDSRVGVINAGLGAAPAGRVRSVDQLDVGAVALLQCAGVLLASARLKRRAALTVVTGLKGVAIGL